LSEKYHRELVFPDSSVDILIRRSRRKTIAIHVYPQGRPVELRAPLKCPWHEINAFLESKSSWIKDSVEELSKLPPPVKPCYIDGSQHRFLGQSYSLQLRKKHRTDISLRSGVLLVSCRQPTNEALVNKHLNNWYKEQGLKLFRERLSYCLTRFEVPPVLAGLEVRKMKSRWGSCSQSGVITLNSLLVRADIAAIDLVITHELCHLRHFSHDRHFYSTMDEVMPNWREREKLLR